MGKKWNGIERKGEDSHVNNSDGLKFGEQGNSNKTLKNPDSFRHIYHAASADLELRKAIIVNHYSSIEGNNLEEFEQ